MRGRPRLSDEAAAQIAARIINTAVALKYRPTNRQAALQALGFATERDALLHVVKRHRGRVGKLVGDSVRDLFPAINLVQLAVSLVLDHGLTHYRAAKATGVDLTNLKRALIAGAIERESAKARRLALNTQVTDAKA